MNAIGMQIVTVAFMCSLAFATLAPAPARNADRLLLSLLGTVFLAVIVMGVLALLDVLTGTAILAGVGASIMVPCAWLARAPKADFDEADEDDDGGGIPPYEPFPGAGPDDWRPAPEPALWFPAIPRMPASTPELAPAGPRAELPLDADVPGPAARPLNPRFPLIVTEPWSEPRPPVVLTPPPVPPLEPRPPVVLTPPPEPAAADPAPRRPRMRRADHRSIVHRRAAGRHEVRRRRGAVRRRLLHGWRRRPWLAGGGDAERSGAADEPR